MSQSRMRLPAHVLKINEIFHSIQGESTHAGRPCVFVRLTYCNIRCTYCDTAYAFEEGKDMTVEEVAAQVRGYGCRLVEITGGEPMYQENADELMARLCDEGFEVLLETGGTIDIGGVDPRVRRIVDFKCPSSGMMKKNCWDNVAHLNPRDEVKFVIGDRADYEWALGVIRNHSLTDRCPVLLSATFGVLHPGTLADWVVKDRLPVRIQLQMHKYLWAPEARGV